MRDKPSGASLRGRSGALDRPGKLVQLEPLETAQPRAANAARMPCSRECSQAAGRQQTPKYSHCRRQQRVNFRPQERAFAFLQPIEGSLARWTGWVGRSTMARIASSTTTPSTSAVPPPGRHSTTASCTATRSCCLPCLPRPCFARHWRILRSSARRAGPCRSPTLGTPGSVSRAKAGARDTPGNRYRAGSCPPPYRGGACQIRPRLRVQDRARTVRGLCQRVPSLTPRPETNRATPLDIPHLHRVNRRLAMPDLTGFRSGSRRLPRRRGPGGPDSGGAGR
jgi:hypothetical protein